MKCTQEHIWEGLHICMPGRRQLCLVVEVMGPELSLGGLPSTTWRA